MKEIVFVKARICEVKHNLAKISPANAVASAVKVVAIMTPEIAGALELRWLLFDKEKDVKNGYAEVLLATEMNNLRVKFEAPKLEGLDIYVDKAAKFKVFTKGDGKKKAKRLMVSFMLHLFGSPFHLLEYLLKIGGVEGTCKLMPRQEELFGATAAADSTLIQQYDAEGWSARIEVKEMPGGTFSMTRRAAGNSKKLNQTPPTEFSSESDARQAGAEVIQQWAGKASAGLKGKKKASAVKLVDWSAQFINPQLSIVAGTAPEAIAN